MPVYITLKLREEALKGQCQYCGLRKVFADIDMTLYVYKYHMRKIDYIFYTLNCHVRFYAFYLTVLLRAFAI